MILSIISEYLPFGGGLVFFIIFAVIAFIAYKTLKKTVKMALRMTIVAVLLLIALIGGISLWVYSLRDEPTEKRPTTNKSRR